MECGRVCIAERSIGVTENNLTEVQLTRDSLLEQILSPANLNRAYKQMVSNKGSGGIEK